MAPFDRGHFFAGIANVMPPARTREMSAFGFKSDILPLARRDGGSLMAEYRAYAIASDGHFIGFEPLICADDHEAIEKAKRLIDKYDVELWNGNRFVTRLSVPEKSGGGTAAYEA
jgi:hypothetical protein